MRAQFVRTDIRENATIGYFAEVGDRRAAWLKLSGGGMDVGWIDLAAPRFQQALKSFVGSQAPFDPAAHGYVDELEAALDAVERDRGWYCTAQLVLLERERETWQLLTIGGVRILAGGAHGLEAVGLEDILRTPGGEYLKVATAVLSPTLKRRLGGGVQPNPDAAAGRSRLRRQAFGAGDGPVVVVSHPWWIDLPEASVAEAARSPNPAQTLFDRHPPARGEAASILWLG